MTKKNYGLKLIFTIVAMISLFTCITGCAVPVGSRVGDNAPDFTLSTLGDVPVTLSELKGKPILLVFWTTRCDACEYQMRFLESAHNEMNNEVEFINIDIQQDSYTVKSFMDNYKASRNFSLPVALDSDGMVSEDYNVIYTPTNVVIDREGVIQYIKKGAFRNADDILAIFNDLE
jgi:cytochrome c biogenesis protein CcmG/thiol:disulfide interchange protein DsbE